MKNIHKYFCLIKTDVPISILVNNGGFIPLASNIISKLGIINTNIKNPYIIDIIIKIIGYMDILTILDLRFSSLS